MKKSELEGAFKESFESASNVTKAEQMSAYMRNQFEYYGIPMPKRVEISQDLIKKYPLKNFNDCKEFVSACFENEQREWQYTGLWVMIKHEKMWDESILEFAENLATIKSWWDTVDTIAPNCIGRYLLKHPELQEALVKKWIASENMWINRIAIIHQLLFKEKTNLDILKNVIQNFNQSNEFFIQKAIGWALRQLSKTNQKAVIDIVKIIPLKPLSKREAIKYIEFT